MDNAVVLAEGVFGTTYGKTANGLVRYTRRYKVTSVIDSTKAGLDAGEVLTGKTKGIPIVKDVQESLKYNPTTLVVGVATDGGFIPENYRSFIRDALSRGMDVVSGLHEFISDDPEFSGIASRTGSRITDVRKMFRDLKPPFTGRIREVGSRRIAVLGTDSAIGKRTTAVILTNSLKESGINAMMIGTGQTAWMQGFEYTVVIDSMINDFIPGGLESTVLRAWEDLRPDVMFIEGQGSVLHPAYPGSFEIIGACRPDAIILQHAPKRFYFDGFPEFRIPELDKYIRILEMLSDRKVIAISLNTENMTSEEIDESIEHLERKYGRPVFDPLRSSPSILSEITAT
ncbi:MAG TPA: DUF1611 domain-containing protein [Thermoplasmataceae archaeon]|nr:DUF1611 domain-containing protein [Thermoplasmatales archaeon AK]HLH85552.1 DUF1611 domain-containing protein [Thermoplasmataceae archaeon]